MLSTWLKIIINSKFIFPVYLPLQLNVDNQNHADWPITSPLKKNKIKTNYHLLS